MASISTDRKGLRRIFFYDVSGARKKIHLGRLPMKQAITLKVRIEALLAAKAGNYSVDRETAAWAAGIEDDLAEKLVAVGLLVEKPKTEVSCLGELIARVVENRSDAKPRTLTNLKQAGAKFLDHFGPRTGLDRISAADVDSFVSSLRQKYSNAYVSRLVKYGKQFFHAAKRGGWVTSNPFEGVKAGSMANPDRLYFVPPEDVQKIIEACPDREWRLIVALARFGGLRCPSELSGLTWGDIDWEKGRFLVRSPKTAHHADGGRRWVPIFPELRPHLEEVFESAEPDEVYVVSRTKCHETNLRTSFERIVLRAGLVPWPKAFQNMRASRETELVRTFPLHVVTAWIGNSARVAAKHYLMVTDADFQLATQPIAPKTSEVKVEIEEGAVKARNAARSAAESDGQGVTIRPVGDQNVRKNKACQRMSLNDKSLEYARQESNL